MKSIKKFFLNTVFILLAGAAIASAQDAVDTAFANTEPGIMMQDLGSLWVQNQNGVMIWAANVKRGERMEIYLTDQVDSFGN